MDVNQFIRSRPQRTRGEIKVTEYELCWSFSEPGKNLPRNIALTKNSDFTDWPSYFCSNFSRLLEDWYGHGANSKMFANPNIVFRIRVKKLVIDLPIEDEIIDLHQLEEKIKDKMRQLEEQIKASMHQLEEKLFKGLYSGVLSPQFDIDRYCLEILNFVVKIKIIWADFRIKKLLEMRALLSKNNQLGTNQQLSIDQLDTNETLSNVQLGTDFEKLYIEKYFTDVTFVFDNKKEIKAHKLILMARSPVFQAMLQNDMLESKQNRVQINDMDPESFEKLIRYIYTGRMNVTSEDKVADIIVGAEKYGLTEFRDYCEAEVKKLMNVENVADCFIVSHLLNLDSLKRSTIEFILSKKQEVLKTDGYKNLIKNRADLLAELFEKS